MKPVLGLLCIVYTFSIFAENTIESAYDQINRSIIISPKSAAFSGADLSLSDGAYAGASPSNLIKDSINSLQFSYANYFGDALSSSALSYVNSISNRSAFSVTTGYIYIPDIQDNRNLATDENGDPVFNKPVTITSCSQIHFKAGFGLSLVIDKPFLVSAGVALNASRNRLVDYTGYGIGMDLGSTFMFPAQGLSAVLLVENVFGSYTHWSSSYSERGRQHVRLGIGWEKAIDYFYGRLKLGYTSPDLLSNEGINGFEVDEVNDELVIEKPRKYTLSKNPELIVLGGRLGLEYTIMQIVAVRCGVARDRFSFGAGLSLFRQRAGIDFAYMIHSLPGTYQFSLSYKW
ncbi:MAG TPA: hypothetical protein VHO70_03405 [Chitinispirillaceae bacterium]|nr:hypothetical protein [Chitinispirillaceae bacterium]